MNMKVIPIVKTSYRPVGPSKRLIAIPRIGAE